MPFFAPTDDPGANFPELLRRVGLTTDARTDGSLDVPHATTCVALRFADGVVMAGDRRAVEGFSIEQHGDIDTIASASRKAKDYLQWASERRRDRRCRRVRSRRHLIAVRTLACAMSCSTCMTV